MKPRKSISATKFMEEFPALLDKLDAEGLVITRHGRPVARILPYTQKPAALIGILKDKIRVNGGLHSTGLRWDAHDQP